VSEKPPIVKSLGGKAFKFLSGLELIFRLGEKSFKGG